MVDATRRILFLAANPVGSSRSRLDEEAREIRQGLERSKGRDHFEIITRWAVDADELRRSLLDIEPHIIHFSGYGTDDQGLVLHADEDDLDGDSRPASGKALANLFELFAGQVECVVLNACYSQVQATSIYQHVDCVIGMNQAVGDRAAIKFAVGFYDALGAGRSYEIAYKFGCSAIDFEDVVQRLTPVLMARGADDGGSEISGSDVSVESSSVSRVAERSVKEVALENPEGQVALRSPFYVVRSPIESDCYAQIEKPGALIRIKAARQMGKSSLMTRILAHGTEAGYRSVPIYFQEADGEVFGNLEQFLRWFCAIIAEELELDIPLEKIWKSSALGNKRKCTNFFQKHLLPQIKTPLVLGLDEVDLVFQHLKIAQDFFALLRTWHERGKNQATWQNLRLVIVHSREVYIPLDMHQSPFNVGMPVELPEFTIEQVSELSQRHGLSLAGGDVVALTDMVGGHPYLVRMALHELARRRMTLAELLKIAPTEAGPYEEHLRRHLTNLNTDEKLAAAVEVMIGSAVPVVIGTDEAFQLDSMGVVQRRGNAVEPLCNLYRQYFRARL